MDRVSDPQLPFNVIFVMKTLGETQIQLPMFSRRPVRNVNVASLRAIVESGEKWPGLCALDHGLDKYRSPVTDSLKFWQPRLRPLSWRKDQAMAFWKTMTYSDALVRVRRIAAGFSIRAFLPKNR